MKRAVVLVSGGMDSLYTAAIAHEECDELYFLHFSYGQLTEEKEKGCFRAIAKHYHAIQARIVDYQWLAEIGGSALTDKSLKIEEMGGGTPNTYVPFRNATMLCAAVAWAEVIQASRIYIGAVEEDSSGYPDCRRAFFEAMTEVIVRGTVAANISIYTPVLHMSKQEIVEDGLKRRVPFELSWSCYTGLDKACGKCPSCLLRLNAFHKAGHQDPIPYQEL